MSCSDRHVIAGGMRLRGIDFNSLRLQDRVLEIAGRPPVLGCTLLRPGQRERKGRNGEEDRSRLAAEWLEENE